MKNNARGKRRDRKTGMSPYARYGKTPYLYTETVLRAAGKALKGFATKRDKYKRGEAY